MKKKDIEIIVKLFLYIKQNREQCKIFKLSNIKNLFNNYKLVINNTFKFFKKRQIIDILDFFGRIYSEILKSFTIIKMRMNDENLENFQKIDEDELFNEINKEADKKIHEIEKLIKTTKKMAEINIKKSRNEDEFRKNVEENDELFDDLIEELNDLCNEQKNYLKQKNNYIILGILKLKEYQKKKGRVRQKNKRFQKCHYE